ncbi:jg8342 [Pararge aegeria aegeria]|uniref:Jg8342 protein n=1 Tax=Pararge aegeria aegeria TaxID=348720 RepID=A0A8S4SK65_9NEOP|nr:jg8342 [Pararge aegeria aegeria]
MNKLVLYRFVLTILAALSRRKESAAPLTAERDGAIFRHPLSYPLALVLRLRVLQIVCGISTLVMGSVAFIEERQKFNMGLGIPAGSLSILAAAVSIHTSRGWGVSSGASAGIAAAILWAASGCLLIALIVQCLRTILDPPGFNHGVRANRSRCRYAPERGCLRADRLQRMTRAGGPARTQRHVSEAPAAASAPAPSLPPPDTEREKGGRVAWLI